MPIGQFLDLLILIKEAIVNQKWRAYERVRPCVRRKFLNFLFSWVSEMFGFWSLEFFWKNPDFSNSQKFRKNKVGNHFLFLGQKNYEKMTLKSNFGNREKLFPTQKPTWMFGLKFGMQGLTGEGPRVLRGLKLDRIAWRHLCTTFSEICKLFFLFDNHNQAGPD